MKILNQYQNGNYRVTILEDGTKIRETQEDEFLPEFSENIDIKITDYCDANCSWCHEKSTIFGKHANLNARYIKTLHPGTELAIGGGNPISHPHLWEFLEELKNAGVIANLTVNQFHFMQPNIRQYLTDMVKYNLVHGIGLSMKTPTDEFIQEAKGFKNAVIHTIAGINPVSHYEKLSGFGLKVLILGYKTFGRGIDYKNSKVDEKIQNLYDELPNLISGFKVVSFDNLAIEQLNPKRLMSQKKWDEFYMGDDGSHTFYIDMVKNQFAKNSTANTRFDIEDGMSIKDMFTIVKAL